MHPSADASSYLLLGQLGDQPRGKSIRYLKPTPEAISELTRLLAPGDTRR
ncbi:hypothetical protein ACFY1L_50410 [Streptomyces sp. NPDC001663]